jgi:tRNA(Ile2) C34 agmatinyltransferase TiaS
VIYVGIDDTDTLDTRGTNQLARQLARHLAGRLHCRLIVRHQLLEDPRVPCTLKNGSASLVFESEDGQNGVDVGWLVDELRTVMRAEFVEGSDPGLCVATRVPTEIVEYGRRCKTTFIEQGEARELARKHAIHLEGLGGTEGGVIGALAAVGLVKSGDDGRIVLLDSWHDDLTGICEVASIRARRVDIRELPTLAPVETGAVDIGKRLRPNLRGGQPVLFVSPHGANWEAVRLK